MRDIDALPGDSRLKDVVWEMLLIHANKQSDYGLSTDPFSNIRSSQDFGVEPWVGSLVRMNDKVTRLKKFAQGHVLQNESAKDSMLDIALYSLITLILYQEEDDEKTT